MTMNVQDTTPAAQLTPSLNRKPEYPRHIHLMGICGTGMASLAGILKEKGYSVSGSDQNIYPPMSHFLEKLSIPVLSGYKPDNLSPKPDLIIVGNVITKYNPEAVELSRLGIPYLSLPQALKIFAMEGKRSIVITGTHGKTTTSALASWILDQAGLDPSFMVGGILHNFPGNFRLGEGPYIVIEGDEYDTAFFDKGPKFLHYSPWIAILTSIEFDHGDIYRDLDHVVENFRKFIDLIPSDGLLIANGDDPIVSEETRRAKCPVVTYGFTQAANWRTTGFDIQGDYTDLRVSHNGKETTSIQTPLYGRHNISNLLSVVAMSDFLGIEIDVLSDAIKSFKGVKRRQEVKGEKGGILVLDDFAHHPTAVEATIGAVKERYQNRRLISVFEPRSNTSRRNVFQERYVQCFDMADLVFIPEPPLMEKVPPDERFSSRRLVEDLNNNGMNASYFPATDLLLQDLLAQCQEGDVVLFMSNGSFDHLPERFLKALG